MEQPIGFTVEIKYIVMDDVPQIPTLRSAPGIVAYGPADESMFEPNAVVVAADSGQAMLLGCQGNRTYTGLPQSELYFSIPGDEWVDVAAALDETRTANQTLGIFSPDKLVKLVDKLRWNDPIGRRVPWKARAVLRPAMGGSR